MSLSNSLHANSAPNHFERIAKILQSRRRAGDRTTCDVEIQLKDGTSDMVHSMVVAPFSTVFAEALDRQRAPYQPFAMKEFDSGSVKKVFDWMYSGEIDIPEATIADVLAVASFLRVTILQNQIEQKIRNHNGSPILALNIASARAHTVLDSTMTELVVDVANKVNGLSEEEVGKLTVNSIIALMAAVLPMEKKIPILNMFILWIKSKQPEKETIHTVIQSLAIADITYDALYTIRYSLKQYLSNLDVASKSKISISPSGTVGIQIVTKKKTIERSSSSVSNIVVPPQYHRTRSEISQIEKMPDPFVRSPANPCHTKSEMEMIQQLPDPFLKSVSSSHSNNSILYRESSNGFPKCFTRSEVENLQQMTDPFTSSKSEKENSSMYGFRQPGCTAPYPGWSKNIIDGNKAASRQTQLKAKYTPSEAQMLRNIPDPFVQSSRPVILSPAVGREISSSRGMNRSRQEIGGAKQSFSGHNNNNYMQGASGIPPSVIISTVSVSTPSARSVTHPEMIGAKKTESEILEIKNLPSFHSNNSFHTVKTSQPSGHSIQGAGGQRVDKNNNEKSQKSEKKKMQRSAYLYPNYTFCELYENEFVFHLEL